MGFTYAPPAEQNDFEGHVKEKKYLAGWSDLIAERFRFEIDALEERLSAAPLFFSELEYQLPNGTPTAPVPWVGFPKALTLKAKGNRADALKLAEVLASQTVGYEDEARQKPITRPYRQQDEYLEWAPMKANGKVVGMAFTAEGPEYWEHLASVDQKVVRALYSKFTGRNVEWKELAWSTDVWAEGRHGQSEKIYARGDYDPYNAVNLLECAAHLTHPANTLGAEIDLAARATVQRRDSSGDLVNERRRLACCSDFGDPNRNSDPTIGLAVNQTVRGGTSITLANPVGLYIKAFDTSRVADGAGNALDGWWTPTRGKPGRTLRAEFRAPAGSALTLDDVRVGNNEALTTGGQLAELMTMVLYAQATNLDVAEPGARACPNRCCVPKGSAPEQSLLGHVMRDEKCKPGMVNAYPELGSIGINPFTRRTLGRRVNA